MSHGHRSGHRQKVNAAVFPLRRMPPGALTGRQFPILKHSQSAASGAWSLKLKVNKAIPCVLPAAGALSC